MLGDHTGGRSLDFRFLTLYRRNMRGVSRVVIGALAVSLSIGGAAAAPASGSIKVARDTQSNVLAEFDKVECKQYEKWFRAYASEGGWSFIAYIYVKKVEKGKGYTVRYGRRSKADVIAHKHPPSGPRYENENEPKPGGMDVLGSAGGVGLLKNRKFVVGVPKIYDGTGSNPGYVTVYGTAPCK